MSADDFLAFVIGLTPEEQISRVQNSVSQNDLALRTGDAIHGGGQTQFQNARKSMAFSHLDSYITPTPQEGSVNAAPAPENVELKDTSGMSIEELKAEMANE